MLEWEMTTHYLLKEDGVVKYERLGKDKKQVSVITK